MAIDFRALTGIQAPQVIAQLPSSGGGGGDDGIGDLVSGLTGLIGGFAGHSNVSEGVKQGLSGVSQPTSQFNNPNTYGTTPGGIGSSNPFNNAMKLQGLREGDPTLTSFLQRSNPNLDPKTTPWCAGFVGSVLNASGMKGTGSLAARSYLNYGQPTKTPNVGDIVVLNTMNDPNKGHVGFYAGTNQDGTIKVVGGNQDNSVSTKSFSPNIVLGYRSVMPGQQIQQEANQLGFKSPGQLAQSTKPETIQRQSISAAQMSAGPVQSSQLMSQAPISQMASNQSSSQLAIPNVYKAAQTVYSDNPVMSDVATTQAILESRLQGDNPSTLAKDSNNLFGIKGQGTAGSVNMKTKEQGHGGLYTTSAGFAKNNSFEDSFAQHKELMTNPRYEKVRTANTPEEAFQALKDAGYATDKNYVKLLKQTYEKYVKPLKGKTSLGGESEPIIPGIQRPLPPRTAPNPYKDQGPQQPLGQVLAMGINGGEFGDQSKWDRTLQNAVDSAQMPNLQPWSPGESSSMPQLEGIPEQDVPSSRIASAGQRGIDWSILNKILQS